MKNALQDWPFWVTSFSFLAGLYVVLIFLQYPERNQKSSFPKITYCETQPMDELVALPADLIDKMSGRNVLPLIDGSDTDKNTAIENWVNFWCHVANIQRIEKNEKDMKRILKLLNKLSAKKRDNNQQESNNLNEVAAKFREKLGNQKNSFILYIKKKEDGGYDYSGYILKEQDKSKSDLVVVSEGSLKDYYKADNNKKFILKIEDDTLTVQMVNQQGDSKKPIYEFEFTFQSREMFITKCDDVLSFAVQEITYGQ